MSVLWWTSNVVNKTERLSEAEPDGSLYAVT